MNIRNAMNSYIYQTYLNSIDRDKYKELKNNLNIHYGKIWKQGEELGERGWTIPLNANPKIVEDFLKCPNDEDLDKEVGRYISQDYKDGAYSKIVDSEVFPEYLKRNFIEVNKTLEHDFLYPATTGITAICEGYLSYITNNNKPSWQSLSKVGEDVLSSNVTVMEMYLYSSISGFINYYFACSSNFENIDNDTHINRHWLMHGRTHRKITIYDYFRVFNLLRLLVYINESANYNKGIINEERIKSI